MVDLDEAAVNIEKAMGEVTRLCHPSGQWRMSIPADYERDSDLIIAVALKDAEDLVEEVRSERQ